MEILSHISDRYCLPNNISVEFGGHYINRKITVYERWMDDLQFYILFNSISVISGRWEVGNERLCAMEVRLWLGRCRLEWESN